MIMSTNDYTTIRSQKIADLPNMPAHLVIEWLSHQSDFMGEAVAKACYQLISKNGAHNYEH